MNLKQELQDLANLNEEKLKQVIEILKKEASNKKRYCNLDEYLYDKSIINWLSAQGLEVIESTCQREGDFLTVRW